MTLNHFVARVPLRERRAELVETGEDEGQKNLKKSVFSAQSGAKKFKPGYCKAARIFCICALSTGKSFCATFQIISVNHRFD